MFQKGNQLSKLRKTFKRSEETKKKLSMSRLGKTAWNKNLKGEAYLKHFQNGHTAFTKGHKINIGRKSSEEKKLKISIAHKGIPKPALINVKDVKKCLMHI